SAQTGANSNPDDIVVTARRREESLKNVPIAVTAITGDRLKELQVNTVKDIANYTPGLSINSDSVGRAFVTIRGIGTTLIDTVQPGVGIFIDGIYQPNTSYLNSPIVDIARIEVLRGPQGTLFGNNTLGGAINIVT
ncbi:TonB-dependent receptor plug domain-containing protein, partial [Klebsiella pneumoniae]|uniref:TonB-dependent receptor plug domain-containing protein n=2 Tax=Pseudomonadota TaxID=1224 RepID=UPI003CFC55F3